MLESEKKVLLTKNEYESLLKILGKDIRPVTQINYYYDTDDFEMNRQGITFRIREKQDKYIATIKIHQKDNNEDSTEESGEVSDQFDNSFFKKTDVKLQGSLTTIRTILFRNEKIEAVLDMNSYLNFVDYELEIEYLPEAKNQAEKLLHVLAETLYLNEEKTMVTEFCRRSHFPESKSQRFFKRKKLLQNKVKREGI